MNTGVIRSMLLIDQPNITGLRIAIESYSKVFLAVAFTSALVWEFLGGMKFLEIVKNLVLALVFMGCFYQFHTKAVDLSFQASEELLREVSPRNIFLRKWSEVKVKTTESSKGFVDKFVIPNLNDLLGTALFLMSKICIWILKLIYTTVYHFTYIFAPVTAVLSFIPASNKSMAGTITSSLWCILLPFVLVVFLALVGNTVQIPAHNGELAISSMDQLIWIFGITLLMLLAPSFTFSLIKGSVASTADAIGLKMTGMGAKALVAPAIIYGMVQKYKTNAAKKAIQKKFGNKGSFGKNNNSYNNKKTNNADSKNYFSNSKFSQGISHGISSGISPGILKEAGGGKIQQPPNQSSVRMSEMKTTNHSPQNQNLVNLERGYNNIPSSKIPFGAINNNRGLNKTERILNLQPRSNANVAQKNSVPLRESIRNIFKPNELSKKIETKSKIAIVSPTNFRKLNPRERQHEV
jgi:hypothetical protein